MAATGIGPAIDTGTNTAPASMSADDDLGARRAALAELAQMIGEEVFY